MEGTRETKMEQQNSRRESESESDYSSSEEGGGRSAIERSWKESKRVWGIAGPVILGTVSQFSLTFVTAAFAGHLGNLQLAAVCVVQNVIEGFVYGIMLGMGSALETLCGQAVGAGQINMLGIYMQRSWIITGITALLLTPLYVFASPILKFLHQDHQISDLAGKYALWVIPQLFAYALNFPLQKFLQSQSKVWVMTIISIIVLGIHVIMSWVLMIRFPHGLLGAAVAGNISWFLIVLSQLLYVVSGYFPDAWTGLSLLAFRSLKSFVKLSLASAIMLCLELWYFTIILLIVGRLENPETAVSAFSICLNLDIWVLMVALGFNAAVSVRVSNELGAGRPKEAKFTVVIATSTSAAIGMILTVMILAFKQHFPKLFSDKPQVISEASKLGYFLAATIFLSSIQPVLHGVAIGAGWQLMVALVNSGSYYIVGLPAGALLGFRFGFGVSGIWTGLLLGFLLQTLILLIILWRTNWHKEALHAEERIKTWGGSADLMQT